MTRLTIAAILMTMSAACTEPSHTPAMTTPNTAPEVAPEPPSAREIELLDCQESTYAKDKCRSLGPKDVFCCPLGEPSCEGYMLGGAALFDGLQYRCEQNAYGYTTANENATPQLDRFGCFAWPRGTRPCEDYFGCDLPPAYEHDLSTEWSDMGSPSEDTEEDLDSSTTIEHLDSNQPRSCSDICARHDMLCDTNAARSHVGVASYDGDHMIELTDCLDIPKRVMTFGDAHEAVSLERITCTCS